MEAAFATLRQYASNLGDIARHQLITSLHEFAYSLEDPNDTVHRFGYLVSTPADDSTEEMTWRLC
jgi:hypothetical protein